MIGLNDADLMDLSDEQKQILDDLVTEIANWRCNNIEHKSKSSKKFLYSPSKYLICNWSLSQNLCKPLK